MQRVKSYSVRGVVVAQAVTLEAVVMVVAVVALAVAVEAVAILLTTVAVAVA